MTNHDAVHKLSQSFADLMLAEKEISGFVECERRHRALCFIRSAKDIVEHVVNSNMVKPLIDDPMR